MKTVNRKLICFYIVTASLFLSGCEKGSPVNNAIQKLKPFFVEFGKWVGDSFVGKGVENAFDFFFSEEPVSIDPNNPLIGYSSSPIQARREEPFGIVIISGKDAKMIRESESLNVWRLHPDTIQMINEQLDKQSNQ